MLADKLPDRFPLISDQVSRTEVRIILQLLEQQITRGITGAVTEFGCYTGTTALFISRLLQQLDPGRPFHVYDSFAGLPQKTAPDLSPAGEQFARGALRANKQDFIRHFRKANLPLPVVHKAWFSDLTGADVPPAVALAFLDGDYYESIQTSLQLITPRLVDGAVIIVDDYQSEALPGAAKAVDEWLAAHRGWRLQPRASLAVLTEAT